MRSRVPGQWGSTVSVDARGEPAGDCILWMDNRGAPYSAKLVGGPVQVAGYAPLKALRWIRKSGGAPSPLGNDPVGHILFLRHEQPDVYRRAAMFLGAGGLPEPAVHRHRRGNTHVDGAVVADGQS